MTEDNKDLIQGKDLLVAYYDVDYEKNAKGSNYWRNRYRAVGANLVLSLVAAIPLLSLQSCSHCSCEFFPPKKLPAVFLMGAVGAAAACRAKIMQYLYPVKPPPCFHIL